MAIDLYFVDVSPPCRAVMMTARHLNIKLNHKIVDLIKGILRANYFTGR